MLKPPFLLNRICKDDDFVFDPIIRLLNLTRQRGGYDGWS